MSANNWAICPKCKAKEMGVRGKLGQKIKDSYGHISQEKFYELVRQSNLPSQLQKTLREDYEIGTDEKALFSFYYGCSCNRCGFEFSFKHKEQVKL